MTPRSFQPLETERIRLREFRDEDLPTLIAYRRDPDVAQYQSWNPLTEESARQFLQALRATEPGTRGQWYQIAIAERQSDRLLGDCALLVREDDPEQAEIGYTLARQSQGQGYGTEAVARLLDYLFGSLRLHRVIAYVDTRNTPSVALLERLAFRREGHFRQSFWLKGHWIDEYLYALLRAEWRDAP